jgi:hypothetical protein
MFVMVKWSEFEKTDGEILRNAKTVTALWNQEEDKMKL